MLTKILQKLKPQLFILIPFLVAFTADTPKSEYNVPLAANSIYGSDINLDGQLDIIVGHLSAWETNRVTFSILSNLGNGTFQFPPITEAYSGYQANIYTTDTNNDGYEDLITFYADFSTGTADRYVRLWYNVNGNFEQYRDFNLNRPDVISNTCYGDIDGNGFKDLLLLSNNSRYWGILYNQGDGTFSEPEYYDVEGYYPRGIACGDVNGDGRNDVVVSGGKLMIYYNTENGFISQQLSTQLTDVKISDFDSDGDNDIVIFNDVAIVGYTEIVFFENIDNTGFQEHEEVLFSPSSSKFLIQDINRDQKPDLVFLSSFPDVGEPGVVDTTGGIYIVYNQGNFELSGPQFVPVKNYSEHWRNFHCADFDGNGYFDFAVVKTLYVELPSNLEILFNDGNGNFGQEPIVSLPNQPQRQSSRLSCFPNPFHGNTTITIQQQSNLPGEVHIYNLQGQLIRQFSPAETQNSEIIWNGRNEQIGRATCRERV